MFLTPVDWLILALVALFAIRGIGVGLVTGLLALIGLVVGANLGFRVASALLADSASPAHGPFILLAAVLLAAVLGQFIAQALGGYLRSLLRRLPVAGVAFGAMDGLGGALLGGGFGLLFGWMLGVFLLQAPVPTDLQAQLRRSHVFSALNDHLPVNSLLDTLTRLDPIPRIAGPRPDVAPPDPKLLNSPGVRRARGSVVRVTGTTRGLLGVQGSGWVAVENLVVTNAHVVSGASDVAVQPGGEGERLTARTLLLDERNDLAVLEVEDLEAPALPLASPEPGQEVAMLGYPQDGPFDARPGRVGSTLSVITTDASGRGRVQRSVTSVRVTVRQGNSGGPVVDPQGRVVATIFAGDEDGGEVGYGIPSAIVRRQLEVAESRTKSSIMRRIVLMEAPFPRLLIQRRDLLRLSVDRRETIVVPVPIECAVLMWVVRAAPSRRIQA